MSHIDVDVITSAFTSADAIVFPAHVSSLCLAVARL